MRTYGVVIPRFWTAGSGRALRGDPESQVLALYLMTCHNSSLVGIFNVAIPTMAHETGLSETQVRAALSRLAALELAEFDEDEDLVWVPAMARVQLGEELDENDNRRVAVHKALEPFKGHRFVDAFLEKYTEAFKLGEPFPRRGKKPVTRKPLATPLEAPPKPLASPLETPSKHKTDQDQDQDQKQDQDPDSPPAPARDPSATKCTPPSTELAEQPVAPPPEVTPPDFGESPPQLKAMRAFDWFERFKRKWSERYQGFYGQGTSDSKAIGSLADVLMQVPKESRAGLEAKADETIAAFFADESPKLVKARHPFLWFVTGFNEYRADVKAPAVQSRASPKRDIRVGHVRAEDCDHTKNEVF